MKSLRTGILAAVLLAGFAVSAAAHCEVPCGIYDDALRAKLMHEHTLTIEKAMQQITDLSRAGVINHNQIARWVANKEKHATEIQHIVTQYFMTQRIKPQTKKYTEKLTLLHQILIAAMKCKQTTDTAHVKNIRALQQKFEKLYFGHAHKY